MIGITRKSRVGEVSNKKQYPKSLWSTGVESGLSKVIRGRGLSRTKARTDVTKIRIFLIVSIEKFTV